MGGGAAGAGAYYGSQVVLVRFIAPIIDAGLNFGIGWPGFAAHVSAKPITGPWFCAEAHGKCLHFFCSKVLPHRLLVSQLSILISNVDFTSSRPS